MSISNRAAKTYKRWYKLASKKLQGTIKANGK